MFGHLILAITGMIIQRVSIMMTMIITMTKIMFLTMSTDDTDDDREREGEGVCSPRRSSWIVDSILFRIL